MSAVDLPLDQQIELLRNQLAELPATSTVKRQAIEQRIATLLPFEAAHREAVAREAREHEARNRVRTAGAARWASDVGDAGAVRQTYGNKL